MDARRDDELADDSLASDVAAAIGVLRRVARGRVFDPGLDGIVVTIGGEGEPGNFVVYCQVDIKGDTTADRDKIKKKFPKSEGWTCTNTGDTTATCKNP